MPALEHHVEEYFFQDYPKILCNKVTGEMTPPPGVQNEEEEAALGSDWFFSLRDAGIETCPAAKKTVPMAALLPGFVPAPPPPPAPPVVEEEPSRGRY